MTRYLPNDEEFNQLVTLLCVGLVSEERVVFIDHNNKIMEVIYSSQFGNGHLLQERDRLEQTRVLKAMVHLGSVTLDDEEQFSTVAYLPENRFYVRRRVPTKGVWVSDRVQLKNATAATRALFTEGEGDLAQTS